MANKSTREEKFQLMVANKLCSERENAEKRKKFLLFIQKTIFQEQLTLEELAIKVEKEFPDHYRKNFNESDPELKKNLIDGYSSFSKMFLDLEIQAISQLYVKRAKTKKYQKKVKENKLCFGYLIDGDQAIICDELILDKKATIETLIQIQSPFKNEKIDEFSNFTRILDLNVSQIYSYHDPQPNLREHNFFTTGQNYIFLPSNSMSINKQNIYNHINLLDRKFIGANPSLITVEELRNK